MLVLELFLGLTQTGANAEIAAGIGTSAESGTRSAEVSADINTDVETPTEAGAKTDTEGGEADNEASVEASAEVNIEAGGGPPALVQNTSQVRDSVSTLRLIDGEPRREINLFIR